MAVEQFEILLQEYLDIEVVNEGHEGDCREPILNQVVEEQHDEEKGYILGILPKVLLPGYEALKIVSLSGMNSLFGSPVSNLELPNIFNLPLILDPASDYNALYSELEVSYGTSTWAYGESSKTIIYVDLELYEKLYMFVNDRADLLSIFVVIVSWQAILFLHI